MHHDDKHDQNIADLISLETIVNIMLEKGICTSGELLAKESKRREYLDTTKALTVVNTSKSSHNNHRKKSSWLKRRMVKYRFTRRLGTRLFGWEWKKVKKSKSKGDIRIDNFEI